MAFQPHPNSDFSVGYGSETTILFDLFFLLFLAGDSGGTYRAWQVGGRTNHPGYQMSGRHRVLSGAERRNLHTGTDSRSHR